MKRSIVLAGQNTSVSLEEPFWQGLKDIATSRGTTLSDLIGSIDRKRKHDNSHRLYGCLCSIIIEREQRDPLPKAAMYSKSSTPTPREWITRRTSGRDELLAWAKARDFRERANEYLNRARLEPNGDARRRFVDVARHYGILAEVEASNASRMGKERRARGRVSK